MGDIFDTPDAPSPPPPPPAPAPTNPVADDETLETLAQQRRDLEKQRKGRSQFVVDPATSTGASRTGLSIPS